MTLDDEQADERYALDMWADPAGQSLALMRKVLYLLEDEGAITCRNREEVAGRILRALAEAGGA